MIKGIIIGILIYSLILTAVTLYKDNSSYFIVETLDIIISGPIAWLTMAVFLIVKPALKTIHENKKQKPWINKNEKYIKKIVQKIIKKYSKNMKKGHYSREYFDLNMRSGEYNVNDIEGWERLKVKSPINEKLNIKFSEIMYHQKEETIKELKKYFKPLTEEEMIKDECNDYWIKTNKHKEIYILA